MSQTVSSSVMAVVGVIAALPILLVGFLESFPIRAEDRHPSPASVLQPYPEFVGSYKCAGCHSKEHAEWSSSQHKVAMQPATDRTVLGDFSNRTFVANGVTNTFFRRDGKFWVRTDGPDGKLDDFEISYTFGVFPLQQYLILLPRGHWQAFGIAWDSRSKADGGQRWFSLRSGEMAVAGNPMHWTGIDQNWNYQCAWCHSTNIQKNYNRETDSFNTTWSEISVGCEACHGPASNHMAWATRSSAWAENDTSKGFTLHFDERNDITWLMGVSGQAHRSFPRTTSKEIGTCAQCHARRQQFSSSAADVANFFNAFQPSTLEPGLYHSDGQQREEVYTYASFLQSRMYANGVTCSDCHNPHSGKLRLSGNQVCSQCHSAQRFDTAAHHHHAVGSTESKCVSCHMPTTTYMGVDARHDHSLRIPRPDRSVSLGTPNACNGCHRDKSVVWAVEAIKTWYPLAKPGAQDFAEAFNLADEGAPGAQSALQHIAAAETSSAIAKASALTRLAHFATESSVAEAVKALKSDDALVRMAAVSVVAASDDDRRRELLISLLADSSKLVRIVVARALADVTDSDLSPDDRSKRQKASAEYVAAQNFNSERPEAQTNLGMFYWERGRIDDAQRAFEQALALDPTFVAAAISFADLLRSAGDEAAAERILRQSLTRNPRSGPVEHALGLSLIRQRRTAEGIASLAAAAQDSPNDPHFGYVLAVAMHDIGKAVDAINTLKSVLVQYPYDREVLWGLASYEAEAGDVASAIRRMSLLSELEPERADISNALLALRKRDGPH